MRLFLSTVSPLSAELHVTDVPLSTGAQAKAPPPASCCRC